MSLYSSKLLFIWFRAHPRSLNCRSESVSVSGLESSTNKGFVAIFNMRVFLLAFWLPWIHNYIISSFHCNTQYILSVIPNSKRQQILFIIDCTVCRVPNLKDIQTNHFSACKAGSAEGGGPWWWSRLYVRRGCNEMNTETYSLFDLSLRNHLHSHTLKRLHKSYEHHDHVH